MTTILSKREVQQSLEHTTILPLVALFQGSWLFGCDYYTVWQSSADTGPGGDLVITHSLIDQPNEECPSIVTNWKGNETALKRPVCVDKMD